MPRTRAFQTMVLALAALTVVLITAGPLRHAEAAGNTYYVNSTNFGYTSGSDSCTAGSDTYSSTTSNNKCTLGAALTAANSSGTTSAPATVTLATAFAAAGNHTISATTSASSWMSTTVTNQLGQGNGAYYTITAPMTVNLQNKLAIHDTTSNDRTTIYISGSHVSLLNASDIQSSATSIVVASSANTVTINGGTTQPTGGTSTHQFLAVQAGAQNVTFSNYTIGNLVNGSDAQCASAAVCFLGGSGTTSNVTIDTVTFASTATSTTGRCDTINSSGCVNPSIVVYDATVTLSALTVQNCTFSNLLGGSSTYPLVFSVQSGVTMANFTFQHNTVSNVASCPSSSVGVNTCALMVFNANMSAQTQDKVYFTGTNAIQNNTFTATSAAPQGGVIYFAGMIFNTPNAASNVFIQDNSFDGFTASAIWLQYSGVLTVQRNTFGVNSYSNSNVQYEEWGNTASGTTGAMFVNQSPRANNQITTWYPTSASMAAQGMMNIAVTPPTSQTFPNGAPSVVPPTPVDIDVFWTSNITAEIFVGRVTGVTKASTISVQVPQALVAKLNSNNTLPGSIRVQTQSAALSQLESSQYSRTVSVTGTYVPPIDFSVKLAAYSDSAHTKAIPAGTPVAKGATVYFVYVLTNLSSAGSTTVGPITDASGKTVCSNVTLAAGATNSTSCAWSVTMPSS